jgi:hypothetical protein
MYEITRRARRRWKDNIRIGSQFRQQARGWTTGVRFQTGATMEFVLFTTESRLALGPTQPPVELTPWVLCPGVKWPGREADP